MGQIEIGTSGYSYREWIGPLYKEGSKAETFLEQYAAHFSTVELNFSYYRMPTAAQMHTMATQAPSLTFSLKGHQSLTHTIDSTSWRVEAAEFRSAVNALSEDGVLGAVLLQFPHSFHYDTERRRYLHYLLQTLGEFPLAVEFRNGNWYNNRTIQALREREVTLVSIDLPSVQGAPPIMDVTTSPIGYIRLHGRNSESWWGSDAAQRYNYLYNESELSAIAQRIEALARSHKTLFVYFNNHQGGKAVKNALSLQTLLTG